MMKKGISILILIVTLLVGVPTNQSLAQRAPENPTRPGWKFQALWGKNFVVPGVYPDSASLPTLPVAYVGATGADSTRGALAYTVAENKIYKYNGTTWSSLGGTTYTDAQARAALSLNFTTSGTSGASTGSYNPGTGAFSINVPNYASGGGVTTMAAIGSSPNANGASISGSTFTLQPASESFGGVLTIGDQNFKGNKFFKDQIKFTRPYTKFAGMLPFLLQVLDSSGTYPAGIYGNTGGDSELGQQFGFFFDSSFKSGYQEFRFGSGAPRWRGDGKASTDWFSISNVGIKFYKPISDKLFWTQGINSAFHAPLFQRIILVDSAGLKTGGLYSSQRSGTVDGQQIAIYFDSAYKSGVQEFRIGSGNAAWTNKTGDWLNVTASGLKLSVPIAGDFNLQSTSKQVFPVLSYGFGAAMPLRVRLMDSLEVYSGGIYSGARYASTPGQQIAFYFDSAYKTGIQEFKFGSGVARHNAPTADWVNLRSTAMSIRVPVFIYNPLILSGITNNASANLQSNSTTQGWLPSRVTTAQRDAIASPATGLTIFCTNCTATDASTGVMQTYNGSTWKNYW